MPGPFAPVILAEGAPTPPAPAGGGEEPQAPGLGNTLPLILVIFAIFYLLMIRPQAKEKKKREELLRQVKKHDKVVTTAGLHGEVVAVSESTITLRVDDDVRLTFDRSAIWQVKSKDGESASAGDGAAAAKGEAKAEAKAERAEAKAERAEAKATREKGKA